MFAMRITDGELPRDVPIAASQGRNWNDPLLTFALSPVERQVTKYNGRSKRLPNDKSSVPKQTNRLRLKGIQ